MKPPAMKWFALMGVVLFLGVVVAPSVNAGVVKEAIERRVEQRKSSFLSSLPNLKDNLIKPINWTVPLARLMGAIILLLASLPFLVGWIIFFAIAVFTGGIAYTILDNPDLTSIPIIGVIIFIIGIIFGAIFLVTIGLSAFFGEIQFALTTVVFFLLFYDYFMQEPLPFHQIIRPNLWVKRLQCKTIK